MSRSSALRAIVAAVVAAANAALVVAPNAAAQSPREPAPQTFDWHADRPIPARAAWGQAIDTAASRTILSWTTRPEFTNPLVDQRPYDDGVVSPADHFGYPSGKPGRLHRVDELYGYYEALARSSPRVRFELQGGLATTVPVDFRIVRGVSLRRLPRRLRARLHRPRPRREPRSSPRLRVRRRGACVPPLRPLLHPGPRAPRQHHPTLRRRGRPLPERARHRPRRTATPAGARRRAPSAAATWSSSGSGCCTASRRRGASRSSGTRS